MSEKKLDGKVAVITGASKGLGKAMATALGAAGARLALVARNLEPLEAVAEAICAAGGQARAFQADIADEEQVLNLENDVLSHFGKVHILINNAGMNLRKPLVEFTLEEWQQVVNTNLTSVFLMCRSFVPHMQGAGYGRIISMTSTMAWVSLPGPRRLFREQGGPARSHAGAGARTRPGRHHGERHQPGPFRHRNECEPHAEP